MDEEILNAIRRRGLLLEKEIYELLDGFRNPILATNFLDQLEKVSGQKMITKGTLNKNVNYVKSFVEKLPGENKTLVENVFVKLGISFEVMREKEIINHPPENIKKPAGLDYKLIYQDTSTNKKIEVRDFVGHFRSRFQQIQKILMNRPELQKNLVSINKIASDRAALSIIGIVVEKRVTKNKNVILTLEDLTGRIGALIKFDREEVFEKAEEIQLDDIIGVKASGNKDLIFVQDVFFPDAFLPEKTKFNEDVSIAFLSDMHCGGDRHLGKSVENFLLWINTDDEVAKKIKYIFITGDNVDGVGIFPGQEAVLNLKSMDGQYKLLASYLNKIPKRITMFLIPGQHDATRVAEPQPPPSIRYASELYKIENLVMLPNPAMVKLLEGEKEIKILMYHGASIHTFINEIKELRLMKAHRCPAKAVKYMLKRRHLAPMHGVSPSIVYIPNIEHDPMVITEVPDVLATGEVHRLDIESYNGVLIITGSCWQSQTPFEEKVGNIPDPAKVPVLNLKTRELRIYDFGDESEVKREN
jgi:DNA polymerase II small subunit